MAGTTRLFGRSVRLVSNFEQSQQGPTLQGQETFNNNGEIKGEKKTSLGKTKERRTFSSRSPSLFRP